MNDNSTKVPLFALPNIASPATAALATVTIDAKGRVTAISAAPTTGSGSVVLATSPTIVTPKIDVIRPTADGTSALKLTKADGTTAVVTLDTTNSRVGIGTTPRGPLEVASAGTILGSASGNSNSPTISNTNLVLYTLDSSNWAGLGVSGNGDVYLRTGLSGSPVSRLLVDPNGKIVIGQAGNALGNADLEIRGTNGIASVGTSSMIQLSRPNGGVIYQETVALAVGRYLNDGGLSPYTKLDFLLNDTNTTGVPNVTVMSLQGNGKVGIGTAPSATLHVLTTDAATAAVTDVAIIDHSSSGTPAASYGTGLRFRGQDSTTPSQEMGRVRTAWTDPTHLSRASKMVLSTYAVGVETDAVTILSDGKVGIGNTLPSTKLHVTQTTDVTANTGTTYGGVAVESSAQFDDISPFAHLVTLDFKSKSLANPLGRIALAGDLSHGSRMLFGTSNSYVGGITNTAMTIDETGRVGIGKTPAIALDVNGGIRTGGDPGSGAASTTTFTNATGTPSNTATPAAYVKVYIGTGVYYLPAYQ